MSWEFLRDIGLATFVSGALVGVGLGRLLIQHFGRADASFITIVGDAIMLAGASLAVTAMAVGYLLPNAGLP